MKLNNRILFGNEDTFGILGWSCIFFVLFCMNVLMGFTGVSLAISAIVILILMPSL